VRISLSRSAWLITALPMASPRRARCTRCAVPTHRRLRRSILHRYRWGSAGCAPRSGTTVASRLHSAVSEILLYQDSELISRPNYFEDEPGGFNTTCGLIVL
jgi:hypothetical protein